MMKAVAIALYDGMILGTVLVRLTFVMIDLARLRFEGERIKRHAARLHQLTKAA